MTDTIEWTSQRKDKSKWPAGEWHAEPDKKQWQDEATGLPCLAKRGPLGHWCGYVGVPSTHPLHGVDYGECPVEGIHGGLTYSAACQEGGDPAETICHIPAEGEPDNIWWFGFDCAHGWDVIPSLSERYVFRDATYKNLAFVEAECTRLAAQLEERANYNAHMKRSLQDVD